MAHYFAADLLGVDVLRVQIGSGERLVTFSLWGSRCSIHASLRSGVVIHFLTSPENARTKLALITAAAPLASIVLAAALIYLVSSITTVVEPPYTLSYYAFAFLVGFTAPCIVSLPNCLIPVRYRYQGQTVETDARRLFTVLSLSDKEIDAIVEHGRAIAEAEKEIDMTITTVDEALAYADVFPENPRALCTAVHHLRATGDARTVNYFKKLIALPSSTHEHNAYIDQYVTWCLDWNAITSRPAEMDQLSQQLVAADPDNISVQGTRGSVLVDLGRLDEGRAILQNVFAKTSSTIDKSYSNIFLALCAKAEGDLDLARAYAKTANEIDSTNPALKRISDLLPA